MFGDGGWLMCRRGFLSLALNTKLELSEISVNVFKNVTGVRRKWY